MTVPRLGKGSVYNFNIDAPSINPLKSSLAQNFPAVSGSPLIVRVALPSAVTDDPGSNFMQQPLVYVGNTVHSASLTQGGGVFAVALGTA